MAPWRPPPAVDLRPLHPPAASALGPPCPPALVRPWSATLPPLDRPALRPVSTVRPPRPWTSVSVRATVPDTGCRPPPSPPGHRLPRRSAHGCGSALPTSTSFAHPCVLFTIPRCLRHTSLDPDPVGTKFELGSTEKVPLNR